MLSVLGFLSGLISIGLHVWSWWTARSQKKAGADAQSAKDNAVALKVETRIAQAEVDAPKTDDQVDQRLDAGTL